MKRSSNRKEFRFSDEDINTLHNLRKFTGLSEADVIRSLLNGAELRPRVPLDYARILEALDRIGTNINQIAHSMNYWKEIKQESVEQCLTQLEELYLVLSEWKRSGAENVEVRHDD